MCCHAVVAPINRTSPVIVEAEPGQELTETEVCLTVLGDNVELKGDTLTTEWEAEEGVEVDDALGNGDESSSTRYVDTIGAKANRVVGGRGGGRGDGGETRRTHRLLAATTRLRRAGCRQRVVDGHATSSHRVRCIRRALATARLRRSRGRPSTRSTTGYRRCRR